jgi:hypothetical protein
MEITMGRPKRARRAGKQWRPNDDTILRFLFGRIPAAKIAHRLGRSEGGVYERILKIGLTGVKLHRPSLHEWHSAAQRASLAASVPIGDIMSPKRVRAVVRARWLAFRYLRESGCSYPGIGQVTGFDHTTILSGLRRLAAIEAAKPTSNVHWIFDGQRLEWAA